ncbi:MAG: hypothetical protein QM770_02985 [Tepidisphaeraceae bacterium]
MNPILIGIVGLNFGIAIALFILADRVKAGSRACTIAVLTIGAVLLALGVLDTIGSLPLLTSRESPVVIIRAIVWVVVPAMMILTSVRALAFLKLRGNHGPTGGFPVIPPSNLPPPPPAH